MNGQRRRLGMGLMFYPRGGSAQVARYLSRALVESGWEVVLASGSLGVSGQQTHSATFFAGLHVEAADYTPALERFERGEDQLAGPLPFHGSFEDREAAPDPIFTALDAGQAQAQVSAWEDVFERAGFEYVNIIHLHHLTPMHEAAARLWPHCPLVTHLHGTELKMLDRIERLDAAAVALNTRLDRLAIAVESDELAPGFPLPETERELLRRTNVSRYCYGKDWAARLQASARASRRIICISSHDASEAVRLLGVPDDLIEVIPNGVDADLFDRAALTRDERLRLLRDWLVDDPQGWDESGLVGSIRYPLEALEAFTNRDGELLPVLLFVGRYLGFKRVPLLVRAYARARPRFETPAPLLIWGGSPGEWEGEHPHTVVRELAVDGVFFSGWRGHDELPLGLSCADVFVAPSVDEPFGQVFLEAMSCGLPVITTRTGGPLSFVNTVAGKPNGWLVAPDDVDALADALVQAVNDGAARRERASHGRQQVLDAYSWRALAGRFDALYNDVLDRAS
ncbi:MAG: glycosyltransferase family 4 protein [Thermoleophilia bacterium]|nr:glycosyltransferase family 4 protein [Thermoleophilia bacterium]MDH5279653.1 glycosyltransferase family 4 protein [Thermoleophilia bacterium]